MNHRFYLCFLMLLNIGVCVDAAQRPNVVLFLVDDMGWMDSTAYGSEYYETPNMERLRRQSMRFTDAYATPLCSPTRASILSGQYSSRHGITSAVGHQPALAPGAPRYPAKAPPNARLIYPQSRRYLDPEMDSLAEVLKRAGYKTGHFGKWHLGLAQQHWPERHGFDVAFHAEPSPGPSSYFSPYGVHETGDPGPRHHVGTITDGPDGEYITDRLTDEAIGFVETHRDEPFFLNFWHYAVHGPWGHKEEYTRQFASKNDPRGFQNNPIMASMLKSVDESLGRLLDKLDELELTEKTLFIFYSDNGGNTHSNVPGDRRMNAKAGDPRWEFVQDWRKWAGEQPPTNNAPLREGKGRIYEGGQRVPLMVRWPGHVQPGTESDAIVGPIDLYPTILDAVGATAREDHLVDGESIVPVLENSAELNRKAYFTWFPHLIPAVSVRAGQWKLIRRFEPHAKYPEVRELYRISEDIGEANNLAERLPEKVNELDKLIDHFIEETDALVPIPNPDFNPQSASRSNANGDPMFGLVPRMCQIRQADGAIVITADGRTPFLGTAQVKFAGPLTLTLNARSASGGEGEVHWRSAGQESFSPSQVVKYRLAPDKDWQRISVEVPIKGKPSLIRLYVPAEDSTLEIRSIEFGNSRGQSRRWDFQAS